MASHFQLCVTGRGFKCDKCPKLFERQTDRVDHELLCQSCPRGCGKAFTPRGKAHHDRNCPLNRSEGSAYLQPSTPGAVAASLPLSPISSSKHRLPSQPVLVSGDNRADTPSPSNPDDGFEPQAQAPEPPSLIAEYESKAAKALEDAKALYVTQQRESRKNSRAELDSVEMIKYLEKCSLGKIISAEEYLRINPDSRPKDSVVVCDMEQGGRILDRAPPLIPMLVVEGRGARRMTISEFLVVLRAREHLDVHDFRASIDKKSRAYQPKRLKSGKALDLYDERRDAKGEPVNFLNLGLIKDNAVPECFRDRMEYKMIELARTNNGKLEEPAFNDFDDCTGFQLLASKGAAHLAHIDRHGVYTTALNEEGKKLWLLWPNVPLEDLQGDVPDGGIAIFIDEGDMLIQPPNTLHAPITLEDCLMTGTMHWHSSHLLSILQYTKAEIENPALTNEAMARQFIPKMTILLELWKNDPKAYPWPPQKDLEEAFHILDVSSSRLHMMGTDTM
ncbi:hypothetical protein ACHAPO_008461 [Fusarium lateritium]